jgi:LacI family transcriptional regulator
MSIQTSPGGRNIVRIKDIAEKAHVSTGTVDRILHNRGRVSESAKEKVMSIARELNYEPNLLARALVSKKEFRIAALIPDPSFDEYWRAPKEGIEKAEKEFRQFGMLVIPHLFNQFDVESFKKAAEEVSLNGYDGIVAAPVFYRESLTYMSRWKKQGIPFNLFNTHIPDFEPLSYIGQDSYQSGVLAARLLHYGHTAPCSFVIAHIDEDVPNSSHLLKKEQGFNDYFDQFTNGEYKIIHSELIHSDDETGFFKQLDQILNAHLNISGIFITTSRANTIANYLLKKEIKHISLIGYDLVEKNLFFLEKGVIQFLINQNPRGQGYYGIHLLVDHLIYKKKVDPIKYLPLDIITRENLYYYLESEI